jgi:hypothetical protein
MAENERPWKALALRNNPAPLCDKPGKAARGPMVHMAWIVP